MGWRSGLRVLARFADSGSISRESRQDGHERGDLLPRLVSRPAVGAPCKVGQLDAGRIRLDEQVRREMGYSRASQGHAVQGIEDEVVADEAEAAGSAGEDVRAVVELLVVVYLLEGTEVADFETSNNPNEITVTLIYAT